MTTAIDSNILIDLIGEGNPFTASVTRSLDDARIAGALVVCPVVVAEISGHFRSAKEAAATLDEMGIAIREMSVAALHSSGSAFVEYKRRSSAPKERMLADFMIGGHACHHADRLLTRDRGYYRTYFPKLAVINCSAH